MDMISRLDSGRGLFSIHQPWLTSRRDLLEKSLYKKDVSEKDEREEREVRLNSFIIIKNTLNHYKFRRWTTNEGSLEAWIFFFKTISRS